MENRIENFSELETALSNLQTLSEDMKKTLTETSQIYESQKEGWASVNSDREAEKMKNYAEEAFKIARNVSEVSNAIQRFKTSTQTIDEE